MTMDPVENPIQPQTETAATALPTQDNQLQQDSPQSPDATSDPSPQGRLDSREEPTVTSRSTQSPKGRRGRPRIELTDEECQEIVRLKPFYGQRGVAARVGVSRHTVSQVCQEYGLVEPQASTAPGTSKLDLFQDTIEAKVKLGLSTKRIHRELNALGYDGGRTILADHIQELRKHLTCEAKQPVKRRFETAPAEEMQLDWSPYVVPIGGRMVQVHALGCLLCFSRKLYVYFYRDERQHTLLEGLVSAFEYFGGVTYRLVLDNMSTAVLGRIGSQGQPLWHPRFTDFARHYGFEPFACKVRDPDRKGKKEKSFRLLWEDFLKGSQFSSWEDLNEQRIVWLDHTPEVGNLRVHGTTRRVPNEAWLEERPLLIQLPEARFAVHEESARIVDRDSTLSVRGTRYTVPAALAGRSVAVRLYAEHFEVLDPQGKIAFSRTYVTDERKGQLIIDRTHYANLRRRPADASPASGERLDQAFVRRFPSLTALVDGLKLRMKTLAPVHIRSLLRLCDRYGQEAFVVAASRAQQYRRFDANAVERILERNHPLPDLDNVLPLSGTGPAVLGEVEPPSFDAFAGLDQAASAVDVPLTVHTPSTDSNPSSSPKEQHGS